MSISDKLTTIAENEQKVYDAGYSAGQQASAEDYDSGYEAGKKAEQDLFWGKLQDYGNRNIYAQTFSGYYWTDEIYNPKYPINIGTNANYTAYIYNASNITDTKVEIIAPVSTHMTFYNASSLRFVRKLTVTENTNIPANTFMGCSNIEELIINGTITKGIDVSYCPKLNKASMENIIGCLSDTTTGQTATFSTTAKNNAFTTAEWDALVASKPNWTIALV